MPADASNGEEFVAKKDRREERRWSLAALLFAFFALILSPSGGTMSHPPQLYLGWYLAIGASVFAIAIALWGSSQTSQKKHHVLLAIALVISLGSMGIPLLSYFEMYQDFPWPLLVPLMSALVACGWRFHQKWLSVGCLLIVAFFTVTANEAPQNSVPSTATKDQITVSIQDLSGTVFFTVKTAPGTRIQEELDLENIEIEGRVFRVLSVKSWTARHHIQVDEELPQNEARLFATLFLPDWSRTIDFGVRIPKWPAEAAASVTVPIPLPDDKLSNQEYEAEGGGLRLNVKLVRWVMSRNQSPKVPVLALTISYAGYEYSGWKGEELRVRDQNGRTLELRVSGSAGNELDCELFNVPPDATELTIDIFTEQQREESSVLIRFGRLPIG